MLDRRLCGNNFRTDFNLMTDNQAITWVKTKQHLNKMYFRWLDKIKDFLFYMTHWPCAHNPTDPLSQRGFAGCNLPQSKSLLAASLSWPAGPLQPLALPLPVAWHGTVFGLAMQVLQTSSLLL